MPRLSKTTLALARQTDGNVALEFAFAAPVLLVVLLGILDLGLRVHHASALQSIARATVQYAAINPTDTMGIEAVAKEASALDPGTISVSSSEFCECGGGGTADCTTPCGDGTTSRRFVSVVVSHDYASLVSYFTAAGTEEMTAEATLRTR